jgi:hypothetical protein
VIYTGLDHGLGKEWAARTREEVGRNRLEARLAREARLAKAASLSEEARLAKARVADGAVGRKRGVLARGATFAAALFGLGSQ